MVSPIDRGAHPVSSRFTPCFHFHRAKMAFAVIGSSGHPLPHLAQFYRNLALDSRARARSPREFFLPQRTMPTTTKEKYCHFRAEVRTTDLLSTTETLTQHHHHHPHHHYRVTVVPTTEKGGIPASPASKGSCSRSRLHER